MAKHRKAPAVRRSPAGFEESTLLRSAETLGRMIGALQRQLDGATKRLSPAAPAKAKKAKKAKKTSARMALHRTNGNGSGATKPRPSASTRKTAVRRATRRS
jgi:hypothetical protein